MNNREVINLIKKLDRNESLIKAAVLDNPAATKALIDLCYKLVEEYSPPCLFLDIPSWSWLPRKYIERLINEEVEIKVIYQDPCEAFEVFFGKNDKELKIDNFITKSSGICIEDEKQRYTAESNDLINEGLIDKYEIWIFLLNNTSDNKFLCPFQQHLAAGERVLRHALVINFLRNKDYE